MLYDLKSSHYCDASTFEVNKLPPRAYFIPFSIRGEAAQATLETKRYSSSKVRCLNGLRDIA